MNISAHTLEQYLKAKDLPLKINFIAKIIAQNCGYLLGLIRTNLNWNTKQKIKIISDSRIQNKNILFCISSNNAIDEKDNKKVGEGNWEYRPDDYYAGHCLKLKADNGSRLGEGQKLIVQMFKISTNDIR
jgi:hypothetical protein